MIPTSQSLDPFETTLNQATTVDSVALNHARKIIALLTGASLALLFALTALWAKASPTELNAHTLGQVDPQVRREAVRRLVDAGEGIFDAHPDPDVGRLLQPELVGRIYQGSLVSSNRLGLREREIALPKPPGITRVVLLGDSYVFGYGIAQEERLGVHLERFLKERSPTETEIEVLHVAISSWNIRAECSYMRRALDAYDPDLVVQVIVLNDLNDLRGTRGFGTMGFFSPQRRERGCGLVTHQAYPPLEPLGRNTWLLAGLDHESQSRFQEARHELEQLRDALRQRDTPYLLVVNFLTATPLAERWIASGFTEEALFLSTEFGLDLENRLSRSDSHWNPNGHLQVSRWLYHEIQQRELLPALELALWDQARDTAQQISSSRAEVQSGFAEAYASIEKNAKKSTLSTLNFSHISPALVRQVHGGVDAEGHVAPYAAIFLARKNGRRLAIRARPFLTHSIPEGKTIISVDELEMAEVNLADEAPIQLSLELPPSLLERDYLTVRFVSDDYIYPDPLNGRQAAFILESIGIEE